MIRLFGKKILATCCILSVMIAICISCSDDRTNEIIDDGNVMIALHLSLPGADEDAGSDEYVETRAISATIENKLDVTQLKVLVFKVSGSTETFAYEAPQIIFKSGNTYTITLRKSMQGESYRLVIIANAGAKLPFIPEGTSKSDALKMITFSSSGAWKANSDTDYTHIPMCG
ncbi:MAG: hypothetical protein LUE99_06815 [Bacteroides sp.]|nr:hypothetical protein [Bacteroides sp.]